MYRPLGIMPHGGKSHHVSPIVSPTDFPGLAWRWLGRCCRLRWSEVNCFPVVLDITLHPNRVTPIGVFVLARTNTPETFWARAGDQNAPCDHMRADPPRLGTYMDIQRSAGGTSCPTTRVGGLARGTLGALANIGGWMAGWLEIAYKISCPAHPASQQPDCLAGQICRQPASQPAATPATPPSSRWRPWPPRRGGGEWGGESPAWAGLSPQVTLGPTS